MDIIEVRPTGDFHVETFLNGCALSSLVDEAAESGVAGDYATIHWVNRAKSAFALLVRAGEWALMHPASYANKALSVQVSLDDDQVRWEYFIRYSCGRATGGVGLGPFVFARSQYEATLLNLQQHFEASSEFAAEEKRLRQIPRSRTLGCIGRLMAVAAVVAGIVAWLSGS